VCTIYVPYIFTFYFKLHDKSLSSNNAGDPGSSVSIVFDYGLDDRAIEVRSPDRGERIFFSSLCVHTGSGAHSASCAMGTRGPLPEAKAWPGRGADQLSQLVPRSRMSRRYTSSPPKRLHGVLWYRFCFFLITQMTIVFEAGYSRRLAKLFVHRGYMI
jgi:hypothetical protein